MRPFLSNSKLIGSRLLRKDGVRQSIRSSNEAFWMGQHVPIRCSRSIAGIDFISTSMSILGARNTFVSEKHAYNCMEIQRRNFIGWGDGDEGSSLSKIHEEKLLMGYSPEKLFAVVAAVDMYEDFLPWCQRSEIIRRYPDGSFDAELQIGFKFLLESYVSRVVLDKPFSVKTTSSQSNLFEHLINLWEFSPGPTPETCNLYFMVDFKFRSPLYRQVASMFFKEVVSRLVTSLNDRCRLIYGPGARIGNLEQQRTLRS
ncbi:hypothetical protein V2J09_011773 [Rumex salicifolius]